MRPEPWLGTVIPDPKVIPRCSDINPHRHGILVSTGDHHTGNLHGAAVVLCISNAVDYPLKVTEIANHHTQEGKTETGDRRQGEAEMNREGQRETGRKPGAGGREGETGTGKAQDGQGPRTRVVGRLLQALLSDPSFRVWWLANLRYGGLPGVKGVGVSPLPLSPPGAMSPVP